MNLQKSHSATRRGLVSCLVGLLVLSVAVAAVAAGRIVWKSTIAKENKDTESWRLDIEIHLPSAPDIAHVPMKFEFLPVAYYERSLADATGDKPQERTVPLTGQQALIESVDVGFMDSGSGVTQSRTKFNFKVTRAHGFEAGEYKTTIRDARTSQQVGTTQVLKLQGENAVIDRRSMVFQPSDKKKKKEEPAAAAPTASAEPAPAPEPSAAPAPADEGQVPPAVEERPGGGCHHGPSHGEHWPWMLLALAGGTAIWLRRKA